jgi:undecaprenyl-diphosphatase
VTATSRLTDPRVRLALGVAVMAATAAVVRRDRVGPREASVFRAVNRLPDGLFAPAWVVMQLGTVGAAPAAAAAALAAGERQLARRLLAGGTAGWALSKVVKRGIRRPRPSALLPDARRRGQEATGLGYLSGHAAVAVALGTAVLPRVHGARRVAVVAAVPVVGLCRIYVGAHLPLDVVGGAALGLAVEAVAGLWPGGLGTRKGRGPA